MDEQRVKEIRELMTVASNRSVKDIWAVYDSILAEHKLDGEALVGISIVSAELWKVSVDCGNEENIAVFQAMNEMVQDYADRNATELEDYPLFRKYSRKWISEARYMVEGQ